MSTPGEYRPGDEGYDRIHTLWVAEGSAGQFEERGSFGYRRWSVIDRGNSSGPTFLLRAAAGPTDSGYDEDTGEFKSTLWKGPRTGSEVENRDVGINMRWGPKGWRISMKSPPKDLSILE